MYKHSFGKKVKWPRDKLTYEERKEMINFQLSNHFTRTVF